MPTPSALRPSETGRTDESAMERLVELLVARGVLTKADAATVLRGDWASVANPANGSSRRSSYQGEFAPLPARRPEQLHTTAVKKDAGSRERRRSLRASIQKPVQVKPEDSRYAEEVRPSLNASRDGLLFATEATHYYVGMPVRVVFPYALGDPCNTEKFAEVVRIERLKGGRTGIGVRFLGR